MKRSNGKVVDIRTGRAIARTSDLSFTFTNHVMRLLEQEVTFYLVHGPCRHQEVRQLVTELATALEHVPVIYDVRMPFDTVWIFDGQPDELGFAV